MLPDVTFTNNIGTLTFKRCLVGISDQYTWNGSVVDHSKTITISGHLFRGTDSITDTEMFDEIIDNNIDASAIGYTEARAKAGMLTLPWTTVSNIRLTSIVADGGTWIDAVPVQATFLDETPDDNRYSIRFFGLEFHNPRLRLPIPTRSVRDDYVQMPWLIPDQYPNTFTDDLAFGPIRTRQPYEMMNIGLTGTVVIEDVPGLDGDVVQDPQLVADHHIERRIAYVSDIISQRRSSSYATSASAGGEVNEGVIGYPREFNMIDAMPEISNEVPIRRMFVSDSSIVWNVEAGTLGVSVAMLAQPQDWY